MGALRFLFIAAIVLGAWWVAFTVLFNMAMFARVAWG
jgi:hypothetical protein